MFAQQHPIGCLAAAILVTTVWANPARAMEFGFSGYGDARVIAPPAMNDWLHGGLGKFRYGGNSGDMQFQAAGQAVLSFDDEFSAIALVRADQEETNGLDALEGYLSWHPQSQGAFSWSLKAGAFFPTISLENDDLGWTSPYTVTYSAINSWIGEELRTIGAEATLRYHTESFGTFSLIAALDCCDDVAGVLIADRGWAMDDRATGLFERVREPDASLKIFHAPVPGRTGMFDEIDHRAGWYAGLNWQMADIGKLSVLRYDNQGDPAAATASDAAWETKFWSFGARTQKGPLVVIAQDLAGYTAIAPAPNLEFVTKFQSAFLLGNYDLGALGFADWHATVRGEFFQTRHLGATPNVMSEDGRALTLALTWQPEDWFRLTGEGLLMHSRKGEYAAVGIPSGAVSQNQLLLDAKFFF